MYGVASDDAHDYLGEFHQKKSNPGTGWIMVRAEALTPRSIMAALELGDFYATVGVILKDIQITEEEYRIEIDSYRDNTYTTFFIGKDGKILKKSYDTTAVYTFKGDELYVRTRIYESSGKFACTQPVFISKQLDPKEAPLK